MGLSREEMDRALDAHFSFEARDDVEGVLATLADEVEHDIVGWPGGATRGREAPRRCYETLFADLADGEVRSTRRVLQQVDRRFAEAQAVRRRRQRDRVAVSPECFGMRTAVGYHRHSQGQ